MAYDKFNSIVREYWNGANQHERFGQFFVNRYVRDTDRPWPLLFYMTDTKTAMKIAYLYLTNTKE